MADECDIAQEMQELHLRVTLESVGRPRPCGPSLRRCQECDEEIPEARRRAIPGVRLCVSCQEDIDACHD